MSGLLTGSANMAGPRHSLYTGAIMLQLSNAFANKNVMSLRTGTPVAVISRPLINPNNLKIEGFICQDSINKQELVLLYQDIRELLPQGFVVDDHDVLAQASELVRFKDLLELNFQLIGMPVVTNSKEKIGKVADYATEIETMYVQKLYVSRSVFKSFTAGQLSVDRNQVIEITNRRILIQDPLQGTPAGATALA
jgi:sporulation protein YlmC with PRC-barrel domain